MKKEAFSRGGLPKAFMDRFGQHVTGFVSGFDRLRFRATLRPLFQPGGIEIYLYSCKVLIKDFAHFAKTLTDRIRKAAYSRFEQLGRPIRYLADSSLSKEDLARRVAQRDGVCSGPICLFACVEPCLSFQLRGDRPAKQVSHGANERYLLALASVTGSSALKDEAAELCRAVLYRGRRYRGLNPLAEADYQLLRAVSRGEFTLSGMRNRDLRTLLYKPTKCPEQRRRNAAVITRQLALLRAHGLLKKIPHTHRHQLTAKGRKIITALLAACRADIEQLTKMAA